MSEEVKPKPLFYIVLLLAVLGLVAYGLRDTLFPKGKQDSIGTITAADLKGAAGNVEGPDANVPTTVKEYSFKASEKLPPVPTTSNYDPLNARTVKFALNVWAGWAPIILQNLGSQPGQLWKTPKGEPFKVELVMIDNPVDMRNAYAAGKVHIGWSTVDMMPLFMEELRKDPRVMPRVFQQVDFSNGGDGIVIRRKFAKNPKNPTVADLKKKTIVLAENSPSEYFILNALVNGGVQPAEVKFKYTADAFQAAAAFNADENIAACVSWAPDIYNLTKIEENHMLVSTAAANRLIADIWFARADFARDHPDICEGLVRGIFEGMEKLKSPAAKKQASSLMAKIYAIPEADALGMLGDAHATNFAENRDFFLNQNNPANFERTWSTAYMLYRKMNKVTSVTPFDTVMDFSVLQTLANEEPYKSSKNEYLMNFAPRTVASVTAEGSEILTKVITIHFSPNSADVRMKIVTNENGEKVEKLYDPNIDVVMEEVAKLAGQYSGANIVIEGHTDSSNRGLAKEEDVRQLSSLRANAVKTELLRAFTNLNKNQFSADGMGWSKPADAADPNNHARNRRVEIKVITIENPN